MHQSLRNTANVTLPQGTGWGPRRRWILAGRLWCAWPAIQAHLGWLLSCVVLAQLLNLAMLAKFRRIAGLHSWSFQLAAFLQMAAALLLLWTGRWSWLCDLAIVWGLVACLEELLIVRVLEEPLTDGKGSSRPRKRSWMRQWPMGGTACNVPARRRL